MLFDGPRRRKAAVGIASPASARAERGGRAALFPDVLDLIEAAAFDEMPEGGTLRQSRGFVSLDGVPSPVGSLSLCAHLYLPCAYLAGLFLFGRPMLSESGTGGLRPPFLLQEEGRSLIQKEPRGTGTPSAGSKDAPGAQDARPRYATKTRGAPLGREGIFILKYFLIRSPPDIKQRRFRTARHIRL